MEDKNRQKDNQDYCRRNYPSHHQSRPHSNIGLILIFSDLPNKYPLGAEVGEGEQKDHQGDDEGIFTI